MEKKELNKGGGAINIGKNKTQISLDWPEFKKYIDGTYKRLQVQYVEKDDQYVAFATEADIIYTCVLVKNVDDFEETFTDQAKKDTHNNERTEFETVHKAKANKPVVPKNIDGNPLVIQEPRTGSETIYCTHNFCDKTSWYTKSVRVTDEALTGDGAGLVWTSVHTNWINMVSGLIFDEDSYASEVSHGYAVVVKVDGVTKTARAPYATTGGDYTIDYAAGTVTSVSGSWTGMAVLVSYSYATTSEWILAPSAGYVLDVEATEAQFSKNFTFNDFIDFEIWVYNPADLPNKVMYARTTYKRMVNFIDEALGSYPVIPAVGGADRGTQNEVYGFPFRYGTVRRVQSSIGAELHVKLRNNIVFSGEHATATFYCTTHLE